MRTSPTPYNKQKVICCSTCSKQGSRCRAGNDCLFGDYSYKEYCGWPLGWQVYRHIIKNIKYHHWEPKHPEIEILKDELFKL